MTKYYKFFTWDDEIVDFAIQGNGNNKLVKCLTGEFEDFLLEVGLYDCRLISDYRAVYFDYGTESIGLVDFKLGKLIWSQKINMVPNTTITGLIGEDYFLIRTKKFLHHYNLASGEYIGKSIKDRHLVTKADDYFITEKRDVYEITTTNQTIKLKCEHISFFERKKIIC